MFDSVQTIDLQDVSLACKPEMWNLSTVKEKLNSFSYTFYQGKTYAVVSDAGAGGGALAYLLAGKTTKYKGSIILNDRLIDGGLLNKIGWYVGEGLKGRERFLRKTIELTIREQLQNSQTRLFSSDQLIDLLQLSESRLDRDINHISNERWNASTAIGLANGKHIFCFPWLDDKVKQLVSARLETCSSVLKQQNCILIIPVQSSSIVEDFADEIIYISR